MAHTVSQESEKDFIIVYENIPITIYTRFSFHPDQPCGPPSLLYNVYRVSFQGVKWLRCGADHPHPSSAEVMYG